MDIFYILWLAAPVVFMIGFPLYIKKRAIPYFKKFAKNEKSKLLLELAFPISIVISFVIFGRDFLFFLFTVIALIRTAIGGTSPAPVYSGLSFSILFLIIMLSLAVLSIYMGYKILEKIKKLKT